MTVAVLTVLMCLVLVAAQNCAGDSHKSMAPVYMVSDVSKISDVNAYFIIFMYFTFMESWNKYTGLKKNLMSFFLMSHAI